MDRLDSMNIVKLEGGKVRIAPVTNTLTDIGYVSELVECVYHKEVKGNYEDISVYGYDLIVEDNGLILKDTIVKEDKKSKSYRTVIKDITIEKDIKNFIENTKDKFVDYSEYEEEEGVSSDE